MSVEMGGGFTFSQRPYGRLTPHLTAGFGENPKSRTIQAEENELNSPRGRGAKISLPEKR
jgi:hypothetical protein